MLGTSHFEKESQSLRDSWCDKDSDYLKNYLVIGLHNPQTHLQSILTRHFLIKAVFGDQFSDLMANEIAFATQYDKYLQNPTLFPKPEKPEETFQNIWSKKLSILSAKPISVLEVACGSANDYRFFHAYGMTPFLHYKGIDIATPNIQNAKEMFPNIDFEEGDILTMPIQDNSVDYVIVHDLFEHMSLEALNFTLKKMCKIPRVALLAAFFHMSDEEEHFVQPLRNYYWNQLSRTKIEKLFIEQNAQPQIFHISNWLADHCGYYEYHNYNAFTFYVNKGHL